MYQLQHFISGEYLSTPSAQTLPVFNPATGAQIAEVPVADAELVNKAVAAAQAAFPAWSHTPAAKRAQVLFRFKQRVLEGMDKLAEAITREHGKVVEDAQAEILRGIEVVDFACGAPQLLKGEFSDQVGTAVDAWSINQALGVVAGVSPFNFPAMVPMWMWPLALACGNCFVLKPSERNPSAALLMAQWLQEAGLPQGVFSVVHGDKHTVNHLIQHPDIAAVSFVGSTPVAEAVHRKASEQGKRVQALGGAKNHLVVMPDADLNAAVNALMGAAFGSAGERCMAISVAVAVGEVAQPLVKQLAERTRQLKIGDGSQAGLDMGPLITAAHREKVRKLINTGVAEGAELVVDGREFSLPGNEGYFIGGSLFDHVNPAMTIYREEIFGPVLCVVRVETYQQAVALIHGHEYANGTAIFTRSGAIARKFSQDIQVGMVGINVPIPVPMAFHAFGGWKRSLFGSHHIYGMEGVRFYTRRKAITARWPEDAGSAEFTMPVTK